MKTILISGGGGYLGTQLTQHLLTKNKVIIYDKFYFPWLLKNKKKIKNSHNLYFIKKDISDVKLTDFKNVDIVCDLNGISNDPSSELNPKHTWKLNFNDRVNFAKLSKKAKIKRYIFNSTCSVYGFSNKKVFENGSKKPISTYAKANLKAENFIYKMRDKNFKVNSLRNSTLFGFSNSMRLDLVINIFVLNILKKKKIIIDGDGNQYRPFISVSDICKIYDLLIEREKLPSFISNIVSFNSKIKDIAYKICNILKSNKKIFYSKKVFQIKEIIMLDQKIFENFLVENLNFQILNLKLKI
jgi:nucleoside-diphosphate-sugar epimerase